MTATGAESRAYCLLTERAPLLDGLRLGKQQTATLPASLPEISRKFSDNH
jgi:hypothetical protein